MRVSAAHQDVSALTLYAPRYWTHHDKVVVVDQKLAFLGGVDMCYGRYDTWRHSLVDHASDKHALWPGDDFYNPCAAEAVGTAKCVASGKGGA